MNNFAINIATVNGSGSQTANMVLLKALFRNGAKVGGKNVFPSNISGMPAWFWIRSHEKGFTGACKEADIVLAFNPQTILEDQKCLKPGGFFFFPEGLEQKICLRTDIIPVSIPMPALASQITAPPKIKKLASNMIYVGILAALFQIPQTLVETVIQDQLGKKASAFESNLQAFRAGWNHCLGQMHNLAWPFRLKPNSDNQNKIIMDGNTAGALGLVAGGCQFVSWYPITPSTSLVEAFGRFAEPMRKDEDGLNRFALVQAEDELAAFSMVLGAGWAGTRAMTATSGPGLSLMAEGAGYAYYAEIPSVIWNVQRLGPSTGLPTRTAQGDLLFSASLSHGATQHILLLPGDIQECFEFGQTCFDLAERLQQLVIVLSDLDLGMNPWMSDTLLPLEKSYDRGKIVENLQDHGNFLRYEDRDGDGIPYRTLIGNRETGASYFTRGSGHNFKAQYSENPKEYENNVQRLKRKWETAKKLVPEPEIQNKGSKVGILYYGSTKAVIPEVISELAANIDRCRVRAFPFTESVESFLKDHDCVYVIDQNCDGQMKQLLSATFQQYASRLISVLHPDGTFITAASIVSQIQNSTMPGETT